MFIDNGRNKDAIARGGGNCLHLPHTCYAYGNLKEIANHYVVIIANV